ncbi:MAG: hypothetical protein ACLQBC_06140 [Syntrophales bacterium]
MTILLTYITEEQAAIASDGNVVRNNDDMIVGADNDKTFDLYDQKIIGAFSNNISINNKHYGSNVGIGSVVSEISKRIHKPCCLAEYVDSIIQPYLDILNNRDTTAPPINERSSNILLSGSKNFDGREFEIYRLIFTYDGHQNKIILSKKIGPLSGKGIWYVDPPDSEFQKIFDAIQKYFNHLPPGLTAEQITIKGIEIGINESTIMKRNGKFLGGKISSRVTLY